MGLQLDHGHDHDHHHGHGHGPGHVHARNESRVAWAAALTGGFMLVEAAGGLLSGSLALLADAGHMLTDAASLALAWLAFRIAHRPADWQRTYGFHRFQVLAAYSNGLTLAFIALAIVYAAIKRLHEPTEVLAGPMLAIAVVGLLINFAAFRILHGAERDNVNIKGAMLHVLGDLLGSVAAIVAALVIMWTGWTPIDPLLSALVALLILRSAWFLVRDTGHILLEGAPAHLDIRALREELMAAVPGVEDIHHVHAWSLTQDKPMITLHARIADVHGGDRIASAIKGVLRQRYGVDHATVEIECDCLRRRASRSADGARRPAVRAAIARLGRRGGWPNRVLAEATRHCREMVDHPGGRSMRMKDKIGIVTAAASGMGRAGAVRFAKEGAAVGVVDIDKAGVEAVVAEIKAAGGRALPIVADLTNDEESRRIVRETAKAFGGLDFVWNHVGHPRTRGGRGHRHARLRPGHDAQSAHRADHHRDGAAGAARARRRLPAVHGLDLGPGRIAVLAGLFDGQARRGRVRAGAGQAPWAREDPRQRHLSRPDRYADAARVRGTARPAIDARRRQGSSWCASAADRTRSAAPANRRRWRTRRCSCCRTRPRSSRVRRLPSTAAPPRSAARPLRHSSMAERSSR